MKTVITHIYNEEYLLPWWLNHHKKYFDHGIIVDYNSTDNSIDIIKSICPTYTIIKSRNTDFEAIKVDDEIYDIEKKYVKGWRICLTATEFLLGDYKSLDSIVEEKQFLAPCISMVDQSYVHDQVDFSKQLFEQFTYGVKFPGTANRYHWRSLHNHLIPYRPGRHFKSNQTLDDCNFIVLKYNYAPWTKETIKRKLQIQHRIPEIDIKQLRGHHHTDYGNGLTEKILWRYHINHVVVSCDYSDIIKKFNQDPNII